MTRFSHRFSSSSIVTASALALGLGFGVVSLAACGDETLLLGGEDALDGRPTPDAGPAKATCDSVGGACVALTPTGCPKPNRVADATKVSCGEGFGVQCCLPSCPQLSPPGPGFCEDGTLVPNVDATGCTVGFRCDRGTDGGTDAGPQRNACEAAGGSCVGLSPSGCPAPRRVGDAATFSCGGGLGVQCCFDSCPDIVQPGPTFCPASATPVPNVDPTGCTRGFHCLHAVDESSGTNAVTVRPGDEVELGLVTNKTAGYQWTVAVGSALGTPAQRYVVSGPGAGTGGTQYFRWSVPTAGTFPVKLDHGRAGQPPERSVGYVWTAR